MSFKDLSLTGFYSAEDDRLSGFYVPVLREAISYDRMTGYFRSTALVVAAAGISYFIANGGKIRLIAGAELAEDDVRAASEGEPLDEVLARVLLSDPIAGTDIVSDHRLEVLAYLLRENRLEIRIGVPVDAAGSPLKRTETTRYFHTKYGVLSDRQGNRVAFIGSDNESASGWRTNHESFTLAKSWIPEIWQEQGGPIANRFERHWNGTPDTGWEVLSLPEAIREQLISLAKPEPPPRRDPAEGPSAKETLEKDIRELEFVAAAPGIGGATGVGFATAGIDAWPHQSQIATKIVDTFPKSYLLADEVGLGKTIEAGLAVRELVVSGKAKTALLLVPASVLRQWQEELFEKFALSVPRMERGGFLDIEDNDLAWSGSNPWNAFPLLLASSHLARRADRRDEVIAGGPWDIVMVDEAHHARRRGAKSEASPNHLLSLLWRMKAAGSWQALYLATATPMQMHAHEAWDLLALCGLPGGWAESANNFVKYYEELREPFPARNWSLLQKMSADYLGQQGVRPDPFVEKQVKTSLGLAASRPIRRFAEDGLGKASAEILDSEARAWFDEWLRGNTPMRDKVFRTSRNLLRVYKAERILGPEVNIPHRKVRDRFIPMTKTERTLYDRIESYISKYYNAYMTGDKAQKALGFIMTVYRRRLTSSFLAIQRSLRRRLEGLISGASIGDLLTADDLATLEGLGGMDSESFDAPVRALAKELDELRDFVEQLERQPPDESKMARLHDELDGAFKGDHDTVLIFTQYTDTMDYLRDQLLPSYGDRLVCYSGRGGQRWNSVSQEWLPVTKQHVKNLFREGVEVKILIGTDSLSEGLNLQTCGKLINYDMPWNFMRVEQRIGRIDRIGGRPQVEISNYFYEETVEEKIYSGIGEDYDWFQEVVGPAQPVLGEVERVIVDLAMKDPSQRSEGEIRKKADEIRAEIEAARAQAVTLSMFESKSAVGEEPAPAIDLHGLESVLLGSSLTGFRFHPHPEILGAYLFESKIGKVPVTFRRAVLTEYSPDVKLFTYGTAEFAQLMSETRVETVSLVDSRFTFAGRPIATLDELRAAMAEAPSRSEQPEEPQPRPVTLLNPPLDERFSRYLPLTTLKAAAGGFGESRAVEEEEWLLVPETTRARQGMFVAQVVGRSMEPTIPSGSICIFTTPVTGSRNGRILLVQHHEIADPETGGSYTVKRYFSEKVETEEGWQHSGIRLVPDNAEFSPVVLSPESEHDTRVIAEFKQVLAEGDS